jgi:hypothetical protein
MSLNEISEKYGVSGRAYLERLEKGLSPEEAVATKTREPQPKYDVAGHWMTSREIEEVFGVPTHLFRSRLARGHPPAVAALMPVTEKVLENSAKYRKRGWR